MILPIGVWVYLIGDIMIGGLCFLSFYCILEVKGKVLDLNKSKIQFKGIYSLETKDCGCRIKSYVGGKVVIEGCNNPHLTEIYHKCPVCGKEFHHKRTNRNNGKKELKKHLWTHAHD